MLKQIVELGKLHQKKKSTDCFPRAITKFLIFSNEHEHSMVLGFFISPGILLRHDEGSLDRD